MNILGYKRIIILGNNGSGKSHLAKELAAITGLPLIHLDAEFWLRDWRMPSQEEWMRKNQGFISGERWIIDGMCSHGGTMDLRYEAADLVIFLDISPVVCVWGAMRRLGRERADTAEGHHLDEKFDMRFIRFCAGIMAFGRERKPRIMNLRNKHPGKPFYVIKGRRNMNRLITRLKTELAAGR